MSDTDSFIDEVSEEVRRDHLFGLMKRYGWIAVSLVVLIVGGAAYNEYRKANETAAAQAMGDSIIAALEDDDPAKRQAALSAIAPQDAGTAAVVGLLTSREQFAAGAEDDARATLQAIADSSTTPMAYRQVATFKLLGMQGDVLSADERRAGYQTLIGKNAQLRLLAEEQLALIDIEVGATDVALETLQSIVSDEESTVGLRRRASQLIVSLGGELGAPDAQAATNGDEEAVSE